MINLPIGEDLHLTFNKHHELAAAYIHIRRFQRNYPTKEGVCLTPRELYGLKKITDRASFRKQMNERFDELEAIYIEDILTLTKRGCFVSFGKPVIAMLNNLLPAFLDLAEVHGKRAQLKTMNLAATVYLALRAQDPQVLKISAEKTHTLEDYKELIDFLQLHTEAFCLPKMERDDWLLYLDDLDEQIKATYESLKARFNPYFVLAHCMHFFVLPGVYSIEAYEP